MLAASPLRVLLASALLCAALAIDVSHCRLPNAQRQRDVALGFPRIANRMRTVGQVNFSVLFVDFKDAPQERSPEATLAIISPAAPQFYADVSYGRMRATFLPLMQSLRMPLNSSKYNTQEYGPQRHFLSEATVVAWQAAGWDFSTSDSVIVMASPNARKALPNGPAFCATPGEGFNASGRVFENSASSGGDFDYWKHLWFNHEVGHTMGLVDLYSYHGGGEFHFTGDWSIMGNIDGAGGEYFAWERFLLAWLDNANVECVDAGNVTVALSALERTTLAPAGDTRMAVAKLNRTAAVVAEFRAGIGHDAAIPKPGVLVYVVNTAVASGNGTIVVLGAGADDPSMLNATLAEPGDAVSFGGVSVTLSAPLTPGVQASIVVSTPCLMTVNCFAPDACKDGLCVSG